jgi:hypothetical protein
MFNIYIINYIFVVSYLFLNISVLSDKDLGKNNLRNLKMSRVNPDQG